MTKSYLIDHWIQKELLCDQTDNVTLCNTSRELILFECKE